MVVHTQVQVPIFVKEHINHRFFVDKLRSFNGFNTRSVNHLLRRTLSWIQRVCYGTVIH